MSIDYSKILASNTVVKVGNLKGFVRNGLNTKIIFSKAADLQNKIIIYEPAQRDLTKSCEAFCHLVQTLPDFSDRQRKIINRQTFNDVIDAIKAPSLLQVDVCKPNIGEIVHQVRSDCGKLAQQFWSSAICVHIISEVDNFYTIPDEIDIDPPIHYHDIQTAVIYTGAARGSWLKYEGKFECNSVLSAVLNATNENGERLNSGPQIVLIGYHHNN